jgi:hypothetical protein
MAEPTQTAVSTDGMTVKDLITVLKSMDPNARVVLFVRWGSEDYDQFLRDVTYRAMGTGYGDSPSLDSAGNLQPVVVLSDLAGTKLEPVPQ